MNRCKTAVCRVFQLEKQIWKECLKEVEEEIRLEASKRMRLVPRVPEIGYVRLGGIKQTVGPPTEPHRSTQMNQAASHDDHAHRHIVKNGQKQLAAEHQHASAHEEDSLADHLLKPHQGSVSLVPEQRPQVVDDERDPLESHSSEQLRPIVKIEKDPLETDLPLQNQHTAKVESDPLEVKEEQDPLQVHLPAETVIKIECDDDRETIHPFEAKLRCWALTHRIKPAAYKALLVLLRQNNNFELASDK